MKYYKLTIIISCIFLFTCTTTNGKKSLTPLEKLRNEMLGKEYFYVEEKVFINNIDLYEVYILTEIVINNDENRYIFTFSNINSFGEILTYSPKIEQSGEINNSLFRNRHDVNYRKYKYRGDLERDMNLGEEGIIRAGLYNMHNSRTWYLQLIEDKDELNRQIEEKRRFLADHKANDLIFFSDHLDSAINIYRNSMVGFTGKDLNYISNNIILLIQPGEMNIYQGKNRNTYVLEREYSTWHQGIMTKDVVQFVVEDNLGLITNSGSTLIQRNNILIKSIGTSNITLRNGNIVSRVLFATINFIERKDFNIKVEGDGVIIVKYEGNSRYVSIPERINGLPVTGIGQGAFYNKKLLSVNIPRYVTFIGDQAFSMNELSSLILPTDIRAIGEEAFMSNRIQRLIIPNGIKEISINAFRDNRLTEIIIPNSVTNIGAWAFSDNRLTNITIPNSVTTIGDVAFGDNPINIAFIPASVTLIEGNPFAYSRTIKEINVDSNNLKYKSIDGIVFTKDGATIIAFPSGKSNRYTIPSTVNRIENSAFRNCSLEEIIIPESVTYIGDLAFCENEIETIVISSNVNYIGTSSFSENKLTSITILSNLIKNISISTFSSWQNNLMEIVIPANISLEISEWGECFTEEFDKFYMNSGRRAGTYRLINGKWILN
jgi:hypothetical protein